jgi:hypothetical protein
VTRARLAHHDARPAAAAIVLNADHLGEADALVKRHRTFVFRAGNGLQRDRAAFTRRFLEGRVQRPAQPERPGVVPHRDEVDVANTGRRDEAEQVPGDLPVAQIPRDQRRVAELQEEHGVVQVPGQVPVAPEALEVPQDLSQVSIAYALDTDIAHEHWVSRISSHACNPRRTFGGTH